jgi:hypothetical protein
MNDGSSIRFQAGEYRIVREFDSLIIIGSGVRKSVTTKKNDVPFNGTIQQKEIRNLEIVMPTILIYTIPIFLGAGCVLLVLFRGSLSGG